MKTLSVNPLSASGLDYFRTRLDERQKHHQDVV
jgi:hypothetical protein